MIHPELVTGADAMATTLAVADGLGQLPEALPKATVMLGFGLLLALLDLRAAAIDAELGIDA